MFELKYLGTYLEPELNSKKHLENKTKSVIGKMHVIKSVGYYSKRILTKIKINQYKMYLRPVLLYGACNMQYDEGQIKEIQKLEAFLVKKSLSVGSRGIRNTELLRAYKLESSSLRIINDKVNFARRITKNDYTTELVLNLLKFDHFVRFDKTSLIGNLYKLIDKNITSLDEAVDNLDLLLNEAYNDYSKERDSEGVRKLELELKKLGNERYLGVIEKIALPGAKIFYKQRLSKIT